MSRFPLAPLQMQDEAISSWLARIAARYDLSTDMLVGHLLPGADDVTGRAGALDYRADEHLEAAIGEALDLPAGIFSQHRLPVAAATPRSGWQRQNPAWCPLCVAQDVAIWGEVYGRREWQLGCYLVCSRHQCLLLAECPRCFGEVEWRPIKGRLRIWCRDCDRCADNAVTPDLIPFWPHGTPQQHRSCAAVRFSNDAKALLLAIQTDLLGAIAGQRPRGPWVRSLKRTAVPDVMAKLTFVMLGPLWGDGHRPSPVAAVGRTAWPMLDDWTPGWLPPEIAAPALMAAATFLAAEGGTQLDGIIWNPRLLLPGEGACISTQTLLWHLDTHNARLVRDLFLKPAIEPFSLLLTALDVDVRGLGRFREEARRRQGSDPADRRGRAIALARSRETPSDRKRREARDRDYPPVDRYTFDRLGEWFPRTRKPEVSRLDSAVNFAVYLVIGASLMGYDIVTGSDWPTPLLRNRYVRLWIIRHMDSPHDRIVRTLIRAIEAAHGEDLVLPEGLLAE
jgi:hypothetical protein